MIAIVTSLVGSATVLSESGTSYDLRAGDELQLGDVVITAAGSKVEIQGGTETPFVIPESTEFLINGELFGEGIVASESELSEATVATILDSLETGKELLEIKISPQPDELPVNDTLASEAEVVDETVAAILEALESGGDLLDALEAPAAGAAAGLCRSPRARGVPRSRRCRTGRSRTPAGGGG